MGAFRLGGGHGGHSGADLFLLFSKAHLRKERVQAIPYLLRLDLERCRSAHVSIVDVSVSVPSPEWSLPFLWLKGVGPLSSAWPTDGGGEITHFVRTDPPQAVGHRAPLCDGRSLGSTAS